MASAGLMNEAIRVEMGSSSEREGESVDKFHVLSQLTVWFGRANH